MLIQWLGHSCFVLKNAAGKRLLFDPFDETVGYDVPAVSVDVTCISHDHFDHNALSVMKHPGTVIRTAGQFNEAGYAITALPTKHDDADGAKRGDNLITVVESDGLRLAHLGDLGHLLDDEPLLHGLDALLIPVGGTFTIDAQAAAQTVRQFAPRLVIPMHFKTPPMSFDITTVEPFLAELSGYAVMHPGNALDLTTTIGHNVIAVLDYE